MKQKVILNKTVINSFLVLLVIAGMGFWAILQVEREIKANLHNQLAASLNSTVKIVNNWSHERKISLETTAAIPEVRENIIRLIKKTTGKELTRKKLLILPEQRWLRINLGRVTQKYNFTGFVIIDTSGRQVAALLDEPVGRRDLTKHSDIFARALKGETAISVPFASEIPLPDVHGHMREAWPTMFVATPIRNEKGQVIAVLSFRLHPEFGFSNLFMARPGTSGETYAFDRQGKLLSESRFEDQLKSIGLIPNHEESTSIMNLEIRDPGGDMTRGFVPNIPRSKQPLTHMVQSALSGKAAWNVDGYNDYRGVPVVGTWIWLDEFQFGITHEIDTEEALTPLATLKRTFFLLFAMLLGVTILGLMQYHRKQRAEQKQALEHKQVEAVSRRMQSIFENTIDGIIIIDEQGTIESFNPAAAEVFGYTREEVIGKNLKLLMPEPFASEHDGYLENYKKTRQTSILGQRRELTGLHKNGTTFDIELTVNKFQLDSGIKFTGIVRDISEKKKIEQDMIHARQEAEKANTAKSQFLSQMSHELRTPLNAILGFAQIMDRDLEDMEPEFRQECVDHILKGGEHLLKLINDVLDLSRIETGNLSVSMEPTELAPLIREVLTLSEPLTMTSQINLIDDIFSDTDYIVQADRVRLRQILLNLVSNAIKYNRPHGTVTLSCLSEGENRLRISVTDTGPGIPEEQYPLLFQPFHRLENEETYIEGTGIGLTICQKLADLMGGEIHMKSEVGIGSTFSIDLSLSTETPVQPQTKSTVDIPQRSETPVQATNSLVLYIEDNPANMDLVKRILQRHRPDVNLLTAAGGLEGIALARKHRPALILLDMHLPQISGWEVFQRLQQSSTTHNIPVVAVSANAMSSNIKKTLNMGFDQYLTKPFEFDEFLNILVRYLGPPPSSA